MPCYGSQESERIQPELLQIAAYIDCLHIHMKRRALPCDNSLISVLLCTDKLTNRVQVTEEEYNQLKSRLKKAIESKC